MAKIEIKNLYKIYGPKPEKIIPLLTSGEDKDSILKSTGNGVGVNNISFSIEEGEIFVVMGLSGSGKSTLIRCLNRLIEPTAGEIVIDGENIVGCSKDKLLKLRRGKVAMVFQHFALLPHRNIESNVAFGLEIQGMDSKKRLEKAREAIGIVGLAGYEKCMPCELSGGMQQRVGLARALATDPDILLMDEAFSALDPLIRKEMQDELLGLQKKMRKTIVFITHDLDEALKLGDKIAIMKDGAAVQVGTPEDILDRPSDDYIKKFVQGVNRVKVVTAASVMTDSEPIVCECEDVPKAIGVMEKSAMTSILVVDKDRRVMGLLTLKDALAMQASGAKLAGCKLIRHVEAVMPEETIENLLPLVISSKHRIAVVDGDSKLLGSVSRLSILSGILGEDDSNV